MAVEEQGGIVEHIEKKPVPMKRSLRLRMLLWLILGWASILHVMEDSGAITNLLVEENLSHQRPIIDTHFGSKPVRNQTAPL